MGHEPLSVHPFQLGGLPQQFLRYGTIVFGDPVRFTFHPCHFVPGMGLFQDAGHLEEPRSGGGEGKYALCKHLLSSGHTSLPLRRILRSNILSSGRLVRPNDSCARHPFEVLPFTQ